MKSPGNDRAGNPDPSNLRGKLQPASFHAPLVVVGAGAAGLAAATEAARLGVSVTLIEEHPIDPVLMGMDIPLRFGGRMDASVNGRGSVMERLVETRPAIAEAFELGVNVQLGVSAWGVFPAETVASLPKSMLGLSDGEQSWMVSYDHLIVATGARDLGLSFPSWDTPGVVGARGAEELLTTYRAFSARTMVVLGTGGLALRVCRAATKAGIAVAAAVDVDAAEMQPERRVEFEKLGITIHLGRVVEALCDQTTGVTGIRLRPAAEGTSSDAEASDALEIACDTICSAIGVVPAVELLAAAGCAMTFDPWRGGYRPELDGVMRTSFPTILAAGDCTGVSEEECDSPERAIRQGRDTARTVAMDLGLETVFAAPDNGRGNAAYGRGTRDEVGYWNRWLQASCRAGGETLPICICEDVSLADLVEVLPPAYVRRSCRRDPSTKGFGALLAEPPVNQDQIKRITRAGMGACQGRRCRDQVAMLLAASAGIDGAEIPLATYRPPVRPLPLSVLAPKQEAAIISQSWVSWFSIPTQSQFVEGAAAERDLDSVEADSRE